MAAPRVEDTGGQQAPAAVVRAAAAVAAAARTGDARTVAALGIKGFEFDLKRPDMSLEQYLESGPDGSLLDRLQLVLGFAPGRRLSPFGNGTMQELWVYPALAIVAPSEWSEAEISDAIDKGLFTATELAEYRAKGAYLGFSAGFSPDGDWTFFTSARVARTPP